MQPVRTSEGTDLLMGADPDVPARQRVKIGVVGQWLIVSRWCLIVAMVCVCLGWPSRALAQTSERQVSGVVRDAGTGMPLAGIAIQAGNRRAVTDREGRFVLLVPAGLALIEVNAAGYYALATTVDVTNADSLDAELALVPQSGFSSSVDVVAQVPPAAAPSAVAVTPAEVLRTPGALDNVFRTLQTLPGVSATEEFGSRLAVRGGAPDQNLTMMDTVEIHDPYRLFGLTSAFNPEIIGRFELATGGFSVKYGDRLSSLLLVENRPGTRREALAGSASLSITDTNLVLEGRLPRGANGSWLITGRRTYYDLVASRITDQDFPRFADVQAKAVWDLAPGRTLSVFGLRSRQAAALKIDDEQAFGEFNDDTRNDLASVRLDATVAGSGQSHTIVAYSNNTSTFGVDAAFQNRAQRSNAPDPQVGVDTANVVFNRTLTLRDVSVRQELSWPLGSHLLETGAEAHKLATQLSFDIRGDRNPTAVNGSSQQGGAGLPDSLVSNRGVIRAGAWLLDRWQVTPAASIEAGMRIDRSGINRETRWSPRVIGSYALNPATRLRASIGRYTQSPGYEKLVQSDYFLDLTGETVSRLRSEQSLQTALAVERDLGGTATLRIEGYYKRTSKLLIGRLETDQVRAARLARYDFPASLAVNIPVEPIITATPVNDGLGRAYGFDVFVTRTSAPARARLRGWASYTWGKAERTSYGRTYPFEYDRRHAISAVVSYRLTDRWELATTTRIASGFPRTPPLGLRVAAADDTDDRDRDGVVDELVPATDAAGRLVYAVNYGGVDNLNSGRLPTFARVDLRATWRPRGAQGRWELYVEVINLLNRRNAGSLDPRLEYDPTSDRPRLTEARDQSIPRLPTIGLRFRF